MPDIQAAQAALPLPSAEVNLGGTSTSEVQFLTASATNDAAAGTSLICYMPGSGTLKNRPIRIRVGGRWTTGIAGNVTFKLYSGTSSTISSNTNLATTGAKTIVNGMSAGWSLEVDAVIDGTSNTITGIQKGWIGGQAVSQAILTTTASINTASQGLGFTATAQFSVGNASNAAYVDWFEVLTM